MCDTVFIVKPQKISRLATRLSFPVHTVDSTGISVSGFAYMEPAPVPRGRERDDMIPVASVSPLGAQLVE